ncbi:cupin-like domain-containing protein [Phormidium pseudopriestleyi FRX01]|uniref:Cupin-like domain-containing protein n=1 Tax=Phormidium pseudopriestleyi FRX01 TaxID=1759528 RepID=A0ABS3FY64_9CYAN|nr:cupin-like domain-containing protein [Phormidium pseudopriestleyi]MBO0352066.1 cupin-like domain-containing protein [Phormidium pseudopriestleyi FRX01]
MIAEKITVDSAIATADDSQQVQVMLMLDGGHQCEMALMPDAPLLKELFQALTTEPENSESKLFQIPIEEGKGALYFPPASLVAIATDPPVSPEIIKEPQPFETWEDIAPDEPVHHLEWQLNTYHKLEKLSPNYGKVERIPHVSGPEFLERFYIRNKPVIFTDLMDNWKARSLWNPQYFKDNYGHVTVGAQFNRESNRQYEWYRNKHQKMVQFGEFVDQVLQGGETNDYYMGAYNSNFSREGLKGLLDDIELFPEYLTDTKDIHRTVLWFGPGGAITPLHFDPLNTFLCQVYGRKRVRLIAPYQKHLLRAYGNFFSNIDLENPNFERYPQLKDLDIIELIIEPGEVLLLPVGWWHQVRSLEVSISVSFLNLAFENTFDDL